MVLLLLGSCFEFLFLREFVKVINQIQTISYEAHLKQPLLLTILYLTIKIICQLLGSIYILNGVQKINYKTASKAARNAIIIDDTSASDIVRTVQSDVFYLGEFLKSSLFVVQDLFIIVAVMIVLIVQMNQNSVMGFIPLILIFIFVAACLRNYLTNLGMMRASTLSLLATKLIEFNRYWDLINSSNKGEMSLHYLNRHFKKLYSIDYRRGLLALLPKNISETLLLLLLVLWAFSNNKNVLEMFGFLLIISLRLLPILGRLLNNVQVMFFSLSSIKNLSEIFEIQENERDLRNRTFGNHSNWEKIEVKSIDCVISGIRFFDGLSFSFRRGDKILLSGPNGSGKSTLVKFILGVSSAVTKSNKIHIQIDGRDIFAITDCLNVSYIPQHTAIFSSTIFENLTLDFGIKPTENSVKKIKKIGEKLKFFSLIEKVDYAFLNQNVSPESPILSGGEWQMFAVIRALYLNYKFLIVDEGNSALDKYNSNLLMNSLCCEDEITLIFISHRDEASSSFTKTIQLKK